MKPETPENVENTSELDNPTPQSTSEAVNPTSEVVNSDPKPLTVDLSVLGEDINQNIEHRTSVSPAAQQAENTSEDDMSWLKEPKANFELDDNGDVLLNDDGTPKRVPRRPRKTIVPGEELADGSFAPSKDDQEFLRDDDDDQDIDDDDSVDIDVDDEPVDCQATADTITEYCATKYAEFTGKRMGTAELKIVRRRAARLFGWLPASALDYVVLGVLAFGVFIAWSHRKQAKAQPKQQGEPQQQASQQSAGGDNGPLEGFAA